MPNRPLGKTFAPTGFAAREGASETGSSQPVQRAIEVLRLRLPEMINGGIAPQALLSEMATGQPRLNPVTASLLQSFVPEPATQASAPTVPSATVAPPRSVPAMPMVSTARPQPSARPVRSVTETPSPVRNVTDQPQEVLRRVLQVISNPSPLIPTITFQRENTPEEPSIPSPPPVVQQVDPSPAPSPIASSDVPDLSTLVSVLTRNRLSRMPFTMR